MKKRIIKIWRNASRPLKRLGQWARKPARAIRRARRYRALASWAEKHRKNAARKEDRVKWAQRRIDYTERAKAIEAKIPPKRRVIPRSEWGAAPPRGGLVKQASTSQGLFLHHTVAGAPSTSEGEKAEMRNLQQIAFSRDFTDVSYPYVTMPSGNIYEGRQEGYVGAHTLNYNSTSLAVALAGNYEASRPGDQMVAAVRWLRTNYLADRLSSNQFRPHREVYATACPGTQAIARMKEM